MDASVNESSSDSPVTAKRLKRELPADDDEDISIIDARINVRVPKEACGSSSAAGRSQLCDGEAGEDNLDSKIAEFCNKMTKCEAEAARLRTQLKRDQEKAQREKVEAEGVKRYLEQKCEDERKRANEAEAVAQQKAADAEKKAIDLQKQCERLEAKVHSKEAEIEYRDKRLANAAKERNEAHAKAEDALKEAAEAKKKATDDEQKAAEADAKMQAAKKESSDLKQELEELKNSKPTEEPKLSAKVSNRMACTETCKMSSSSPDEQLVGGLNEANGRIEQHEEELTKLRADNDKLKKELTASKANVTRLENARKKAVDEKDDEILRLKERIVVLENELKGPVDPPTVLDARLETARLRQAIGRFVCIADKVMLKFHHEGVAIKSDPSRSNLPGALLELKPSFFDDYDCRKECLAQIDYSLLSQGFASQAAKEQCRIYSYYGHVMGIDFKSAAEEKYGMALSRFMHTGLKWSPTEENAPYTCTFEMNSFVLSQAAHKLSPVLLDFSSRGQPNAVVITDTEARLDGGQRDYVWQSVPSNNSHANDFKAEFSSTTPDTHLRIFVDPKYLRRCVMASSDAGSKTVEVSVSEDILRLRYGNKHFSLTYYIPTVKHADGGERSYSPIEFGTEIFEL